MQLTRRDVLEVGLLAAASTAGTIWVNSAAAAPEPAGYRDMFPELDGYVEQIMRDMNSPGMTLVWRMVKAFSEWPRTESAIWNGNASCTPKSVPDRLDREIVCCHRSVRLREEGKFDLDKPSSTSYPSGVFNLSFRRLLRSPVTHTSGLSAAWEVFLPDPSQRHMAAYAPGEQFSSNDLAYPVLGDLPWTRDDRELPELFRERIFKPLGMSQSEPVIDFDVPERVASNTRHRS